MEDKTFQLLEKLYVKMQEMESNMATKQDIVRLENKMDANDKVLHDGYKLNYEKLVTLEAKVDELDRKVDQHDVEIRVIRGAK